MLVLLPGEFHGWRSLVDNTPWGHRVGHDWVTSLSLFCSSHTHTCAPTHPWSATCLPELQFPWLPCVSYNPPGILCPRSIALAFVSVGNACPWNSAICCHFFSWSLLKHPIYRQAYLGHSTQNVSMTLLLPLLCLILISSTFHCLMYLLFT